MCKIPLKTIGHSYIFKCLLDQGLTSQGELFAQQSNCLRLAKILLLSFTAATMVSFMPLSFCKPAITIVLYRSEHTHCQLNWPNLFFNQYLPNTSPIILKLGEAFLVDKQTCVITNTKLMI